MSVDRLVSAETEGDLRRLVEMGIYPSLQLAGALRERFEPDIFDLMERHARSIYVDRWNETLKARHFGGLLLSEDFVWDAINETMFGTAAALSHERKGKVYIDREIAEAAINRVIDYVAERGVPSLVWAYGVIIVAEDFLAVRHYANAGGISERDFVSGAKHRPWTRHNLFPNLSVCFALGMLRIEPLEGVRRVFLTAEGERTLDGVIQMLKSSGYWARRRALMHLSHFDMYTDWQTISRSLGPEADALRRQLVAFAGIREGMKVLEVACGPGNLTLDAGLVGRVGETGTVVATDVSAGMVSRLQARARELGVSRLEVKQADVQRLPFEDQTFDAAVGSIFIHFTDKERALREMARVTRPGGTVAVFGPTRLAGMPPVFFRWFEPMFALMKARGINPQESYLPESGEVAALMRTAGLREVVTDPRTSYTVFDNPEHVVRHFVQGVNYFQEALEELPWDARQEMVNRLEERGAELCRTLPLAERTIPWPVEFVRGTVSGP